MRISLIDPRWKEQRDIMLSKIKETTKVGRGAGGQVVGWASGMAGRRRAAWAVAARRVNGRAGGAGAK